MKEIRIGVPNVPYYVSMIRLYLPQAKIVLLNSPREFFRQEGEKMDALLYTAEAGSAWSLLYPNYSVAVPQPDVVKAPLAYAIARGDRDLVDFISGWIELKKKEKLVELLYDHWILGKGAERKEPRWSIIRNVLKWVD